mmetsp:Transcript_29846/g.84058  ORF Transcript_29846/g.84058 Transcript_29846/m.84058 type:complete len:205 (+) Transcript_29846:51-665(+)
MFRNALFQRGMHRLSCQPLRRAAGSAASASQWAARQGLDNTHLNFCRNGISCAAVGLALVHFRIELDDTPPLGGLLLIGLSVGYPIAGGVQYMLAHWQLRHTLGLSCAGAVAVAGHALIPPITIAMAVFGFLGGQPRWFLSLVNWWAPGLDVFRKQSSPLDAFAHRKIVQQTLHMSPIGSQQQLETVPASVAAEESPRSKHGSV